MKLILEGCDNSGKTTLANKLRQRAPQLAYHHPGGRPAHAAAELDCLIEQTAKMVQFTDLIMDRCTAISQQVYSPTSDAVQQMNRDIGLADLIEAGVIFVFCRPSTDWLMSFENFTWREGETEEFKQEIIEKQHVFIQRYDDLMQYVPHVHYDYRSDEAPQVLNLLVLASRGHQDSLDLLNQLKTFEVPK